MAINFCVECLKTKVTANKVCADGFEVENLLTNNSNGFRVEYFVKPPIDILFTFAFPIDIRKVVCGLKVGERKTTALQCFLSNETNDFKRCGYFQTAKDTICIINTKYREKTQKDDCNKSSNSIEQNSELFYVPRINQNYFVKVKHLKLRLLKSENSDICVLKSVEVYGQPNASVATDAEVVNYVMSYWQHISMKTSSLNANDFSQKRKFSENLDKTLNNKRKADIPREFFDPLTNEVMLLPLLLPSGTTVDKSTLDKYMKNEALWGRTPNDPFTNIPFKKDSEPLPNTPLKLRIDAYFTENHQTLPKESLPSSRIVGGYGNSSKLVTSHTPSLDKICVACQCLHTTDETIYKLPCGHLICRKLQSEEYKTYQNFCRICSKNYCAKLIVRYFTPEIQQQSQQ